ncbi:MAG TPA: hypothetical protein VFU01_07555, partial [Gemmatimonadaceae bacterium]|nr:hypothetical protein [Gemmatimonadaceae bacterium]
RETAEAADGRRTCNVNCLIRIPRILNGETARMNCNCEMLCENLSGQGHDVTGSIVPQIWPLQFPELLAGAVHPCRYALHNPWHP